MNKQVSLIVGILLAVLGIAFFLERGFFAETLLGATAFGNMGWAPGDDSKIQTIAIFGGIAFLVGVVMTITGVLNKDEGQHTNRKSDSGNLNNLEDVSYNQHQIMSKEHSEPLARAIFSNNIDAVKNLINQRIDVNSTNENGITPLQMAKNCNRNEIIELLIREGAQR